MKNSYKRSGVIIADDDAVIRGILRSWLVAVGQTVFITSNGLEVVELASKTRAELIMLDLGMPKLNGLLACQRIRQLPGNVNTPIVILTSRSEKDVEQAATCVGATAFLTKPFMLATLLKVLSPHLKLLPFCRQPTGFRERHPDAEGSSPVLRPTVD